MRVGRQSGFTYLSVLIALAFMGVGLVAASEVWSTTARRQRIEQLDWVGQQFVQGLGSYYESSPGGAKAFPRTLNDLLIDSRYPTVRRHLRKIYANPFTNLNDWSLLRAADGGIRGVCARIPSTINSADQLLAYTYVPGNTPELFRQVLPSTDSRTCPAPQA